jgi:hypothetical protein
MPDEMVAQLPAAAGGLLAGPRAELARALLR